MDKIFVRDLADGQAVDAVFEVRAVTRRAKKNGDPFLKLQLGDCTGSVEAVAWDDVDTVAREAPLGATVRVAGPFSADPRYGASITIRDIRTAQPEEFNPADLHEAPPVPYDPDRVERRAAEIRTAVKRAIYAAAIPHLSPTCIIASNTSSLPEISDVFVSVFVRS